MHFITYKDALSRKKYVDDRDNTRLPLSGGTMTGDITIGSNKIITTSDPTDNNHLTRKKYVDDEDNKVSKNGDSMTGDLDMQTNFIHSAAIPNDDSDLVNKKYVDDADATKLNLSGGNMSGDVNMQNHKLTNLKDPVDSKDSMHKKYIDDANNLKLSLSGGIMSGDLDMGNHNILHAANYVPSSDHHVVTKKYVTNFSFANTVANIYNLQMDDEGIFDVKDDDNYIEYTGSNKKVEKLLNLSRKKDWNFTQDDTNKQPLFKKSTINNNFYCIQYLGSNSNNLHLNTSRHFIQSTLEFLFCLWFEIIKFNR